MTGNDYQLGNTISKTTEDTKLWQTEKGIIEISKNTLAVPIKQDDQEKGYVFHGQGKLLLDTIVETEEGAIGKPTEKELEKPFLMLADTEQTRQHLTEANEEDLARMGYEDRQGFLDNAEDLFNRFFKRGEMHCCHRHKEDRGFIFAFQSQTDKLDTLIAKGPKLVYTSKDRVFVSNRNKVVLTGPDEVVCSSKGKSVIINKGRSVIFRK